MTTYIEQMTHLAREAFADHELQPKYATPDTPVGFCDPETRVVLKQEGSCFYMTEVVLLRWNRIILHGDIETVAFGGIPHKGLWPALRWLVSCDLEYLTTKVQEAERRDPREDSADHALEYLRNQAQDALQDPERSKVLQEALDLLAASVGDVDGVRRYLVDNLPDAYDWAGRMGRRIEPRVFYARAAVKRAVELHRKHPSIPPEEVRP